MLSLLSSLSHAALASLAVTMGVFGGTVAGTLVGLATAGFIVYRALQS